MRALSRAWRNLALLATTAFGAVASGLTESDSDAAQPTGTASDRNVDMIIGGQAVLEGVMMRSNSGWTVAVRKPDGGIAYKRDAIQPVTQKYRMLRFPVLRGSVVLIQSLILGMKALNFSASITSEGKDGEPELSGWQIASSMLMALVFGVALFILAPLALTNAIRDWLMPGMNNLTYNLIDGVARGLFFFAYIVSISFLDDIRRVFQYHGAEHKTVYTFEAHEPLTVEHAQQKSTLHPRCGTSFLLFVMAISIIVFSLIPATAPFLVKFGARVVLIPLIAGLAYEVIRFSARHLDHPVCRLLVTPGLWLQRITTGQPDDAQVEIACAALRDALTFDGVEQPAQAVA